MRPVRATCPVRIDLAGGTTDLEPVSLVLDDAATVNVALDLPATAIVRPHADPDDARIVLRSQDLGREEVYPSLSALRDALADGTCRLALLGLVVKHARPATGLVVETDATSPPGAGLGGSSALLVALLGAVAKAHDGAFDARTHIRLARDIETALLRTPSGFQDYYPPTFGGCLSLRRRMGGIDVEPLDMDLDALAAQVRVVYTGAPHHSGITNWGVMRAFFDGDRNIRKTLAEIGRCGTAVRDALVRGDLDGALGHVLAEGRLRAQLGDGVITPPIEALDQAMRGAGARGTKVLGAGGGGCVLVILGGASPKAVDAAIDAGPWEALPVRLTSSGITYEAP